jgi:hypothetical protein
MLLGAGAVARLKTVSAPLYASALMGAGCAAS